MSKQRTPADIVTAEAKNWLAVVDDLFPVVPLVTAVANRLPGPPVWTMIVAPPASLKSELIMSTTALDGVFFLSQVTDKTFASGKRREADDPKHLSLLSRLHEEKKWLVAIKELGTIQSLSPNTRNALFGQLREIYDGALRSIYGTGIDVNWKGSLGFLVGCTDAVDKWQKWNIELGDRFVQFRPRVPAESVVALHAWSATRNRNDAGRADALAHAFNKAFEAAEPGIAAQIAESESALETFDQTALVCTILTELVVKARTPIERDRTNANVFQKGASEGPARMTKVLTKVYQAALICYGGDHEKALAFAARIGLDSIPRKRTAVLRELARSPGGVVTRDVATALGCDENTAERHVRDLAILGLVDQSRPVSKNIYKPSRIMVNYAEAVLMDEYDGPEALRKLFDLPTHLTPPHVEEGVQRQVAVAS